ncbi:MAG: hypothetical protein J5J00_01935 [Deltaproteobacteria bacterium]|nr:hypothetical protein [Deltaproteobacteria bacterium]
MRARVFRLVLMFYACSIVLAFCSIVYELLLGQSLSAFLGNTVLRYSVTIGLYLLSLGIGTTLAERSKVRERPVIALARVELILTLVGGGCVAVLFLVSFLGLPKIVFSLFAHFLVLFIGVLTGYELPLLLEAKARSGKQSDNALIGFNYVGAFAGTIAFAFVFYPWLGLLTSAFIAGILNSIIGMILALSWLQENGQKPKEGWLVFGGHLVMATVLVFCVTRNTQILEWLLGMYLGA